MSVILTEVGREYIELARRMIELEGQSARDAALRRREHGNRLTKSGLTREGQEHAYDTTLGFIDRGIYPRGVLRRPTED